MRKQTTSLAPYRAIINNPENIKDHSLINLKEKRMLFKILSYKALPYIFLIFFIALYILTPLIDYYFLNGNQYMLLLAKIAILALVGLLTGSYLQPQLNIKPAHLIRIPGTYFVWFVFLIFAVFLILVIATAKNIPIFLAFKNRNVYDLSNARANFLKARTGAEHIFVYINSVLTTSFLPYVIVLCFSRSYVRRWFFLLLPYLYSFLTLEKIFFLKFILPLISYCSSVINKPHYKTGIIVGLLSIPFTIYINTVISGAGDNIEPLKAQSRCSENFYSARYIRCANKGRVKFIVWRTLAVPVFTASDSLKLFEEKYQNQLLWGKTSSFLSALLKVSNIKFERETFGSEWGQDKTGTASANSVFIIEQYINFGWLGVILSSLLIGYILAILRRSNDLALAAMSINLSLCLIAGGLLSTMLSGGFLALFLLLFFVKLED